jgi:hypothetical protein
MLKGKMTRHEAGEFVDGGIYWNRKSWDLTTIPEEGGYLPAENGACHYYRLPLLLVMALAPMAGMAFVLFLAVAVPVMVVYSVPGAIAAAIKRRRSKGTFRPAGMRR